MPVAEQLTEPDAVHGEGPVWWPDWGGLRWVDLMAGDILHLDTDSGEVSRWHVGPVAAALRPRSSGGVVIAGERDFLVADRAGGAVRRIATAVDNASIRFNDGGCDPRGRFWCGTMAYDETPGRGALFRLDIDGAVERVLDGLTISNGLAFTADGMRAFYIDTPTGRIDVLELDAAGEIAERRPFVTIETGAGHPDGLTLAADGGVWVALWAGAAVRHYDAAGRLAEVVDVAAEFVTACTFGGPDLRDLLITTSRRDVARGADPAAGSVFRYRTDGGGLPVLPYAG